MHIKNYNYDCQKGIIRYTIDIDHDTFDMKHIRTQYGSIQTTDIGDFLCDVDEYDEDEAQKIEEFVNQQDNLLLNHIDIKWNN